MSFSEEKYLKIVMFEAGDWDEAGTDQPQLSALSWALAQSQPKQEKSVEKSSSKKKKKKARKESKESEVEKPPKTQNIAKRLAKSVEKELDKAVNSPTATRNLLDDGDDSDDDDDDESAVRKSKKKKRKLAEKMKTTTEIITDVGKKIGRSLSDSSLKDPGYLLKIGEKFSSQDAFLRFIGLPGKTKKGIKRQRPNSEIDDADETDSIKNKDPEDKQNEGFTSENEKENDAPDPPPRKKRKGNGLDLAKVREILSKEETESTASSKSSSANTIHKTLAEEARNKLTASRFRYLNEQLYTQPSNAAVKLFNSDSTLFSAYHQVSRKQS